MKLNRHNLQKNHFLHFEWVALAAALVLMACINPGEPGLSLCILHNLGFDFCWGCGLGRSVAYLFRGNLQASLQMHPAGILAVLILVSRIIQIFHRNLTYKSEQSHEKNI